VTLHVGPPRSASVTTARTRKQADITPLPIVQPVVGRDGRAAGNLLHEKVTVSQVVEERNRCANLESRTIERYDEARQ